jgi:ATP-binding cassette subfamily F protein uup
MLEPADVLLLDEPTNDLDIPTLEILEENLLDFPGALVLVTHDRYLLNRVASTVLGLDGRGNTGRFADYAQWEDWLAEQDDAEADKPNRRSDGSSSTQQASAEPAPAQGGKKKLSYLEAREFAAIEHLVENSDDRLAHARARVEDPQIATNAAALQKALLELDAAQHENDTLYARWAELTENRRACLGKNPRHRKQRAVAAQNDDQSRRIPRHLRPLHHRSRRGVLAALLVQKRLVPALTQPPHQLGQ